MDSQIGTPSSAEDASFLPVRRCHLRDMLTVGASHLYRVVRSSDKRESSHNLEKYLPLVISSGLARIRLKFRSLRDRPEPPNSKLALSLFAVQASMLLLALTGREQMRAQSLFAIAVLALMLALAVLVALEYIPRPL
jgi:hypothetical protein